MILGKLYYRVILVYGAMVDINCSSVDWPGNTLYQIDSGSKPRACMSDWKKAQSGVYQIFGSTVGGVPGFLSL